MKSVAFIPARGGSKRLPRKNILPFRGKPLICWTIESAILSNIFSDIFVSTDDPEIQSVSFASGAQILERPSSLAGDLSSCADVIKHHLGTPTLEGKNYDLIYCLYATAPLRSAHDLINISHIFQSHHDCNAVIATTPFSHNPFQAFYLDDSKILKPAWPDLCRKRSSDFPKMVAGNGSTYAIRTKVFNQLNDFYSPSLSGVYSYEMPFHQSLDIDTLDDYNFLCNLPFLA